MPRETPLRIHLDQTSCRLGCNFSPLTSLNLLNCLKYSRRRETVNKKSPIWALRLQIGAELMFRPETFAILENFYLSIEMNRIMKSHTANATAELLIDEENFHTSVADENLIAGLQSSTHLDWKLQTAFLEISRAGPLIQASTFRHLLLLF